MALTYGFYNSVSGDRTYSAEQMNSFLDGVIEEGVFQAIGQKFEVKATTGRVVTVGSGKAWVAKSWTVNDAAISITMPAAAAILSRIDAIVLEVNSSPGVRATAIKVIQGTPASSPVNPTLTNNEFVQQRVIAYIARPGDSTDVKQANITNMVGTSNLPYVVGAVQSTDISSMVNQWRNQFDLWMAALNTALSGDVAAGLAGRILELEKQVDRRTIFRGKNLGSTFTAAQKACVVNNTFSEIQLGDYWTSAGVNWRVADFNLWYGALGGATPVSKPHVVIVPDQYLYSTGMNSTGTVVGGYSGSRLKTGSGGATAVQTLADAYNKAALLFGTSLLLKRDDTLSNATVDGRVTVHEIKQVSVELMNELTVFGGSVNAQRSNGLNLSYNATTSNRQLALFRDRPEFIMGGVNGYWLRDVATSIAFSIVGGNGESTFAEASSNRGIRPFFGVTGA